MPNGTHDGHVARVALNRAIGVEKCGARIGREH
jgi:hypothetical protein